MYALRFAAQSLCAAMLAWHLSLRAGLAAPYWAIGTVYIVSHVTPGAALARGIYRFFGTLAGCAASVLIVQVCAGSPPLLCLALTGWIGACLLLALRAPAPRAYLYALAGATASLIGFPQLAGAAAIHDVALLRVQEIALGTGCAALLHGFAFARLPPAEPAPRRDRWRALDAMAGLALACAAWLVAGWHDGATAVSILGLCYALFGNAESPAADINKYLLGSVAGAAAALLHAVSGLIALPLLFAGGCILAQPRWRLQGLGVVLTFLIVAGIGAAAPGMRQSLHTAAALLAGTAYAALSMALPARARRARCRPG